MWVARNKTGEVILFYKKPERKDGYWLSKDGKYFTINFTQFPTLKWEDEPLEIELISKEELERLEYRALQAPSVPYMGY